MHPLTSQVSTRCTAVRCRSVETGVSLYCIVGSLLSLLLCIAVQSTTGKGCVNQPV